MTKRKTCEKCKRPIKVCFCERISVIENQWPITILQYFKESKHPLNTANIAELSLTNCKIHLTNNENYKEQIKTLIQPTPNQALLIYPDKDSTPIEKIDTNETRPLIFLDGTWRKTRRLLYESPELDQLPKVSISPDMISRYKIRKAPSPESLSTLEAIVHVLSVLEKDPTKYQPLLNTMDTMINKQIEIMGEETFKKNYPNSD